MSKSKKKQKTYLKQLLAIFLTALLLSAHESFSQALFKELPWLKPVEAVIPQPDISLSDISLSDIPNYSGSPFVTIHNNVPFFPDSELTLEPFEMYSELDPLGRCGTAYANICPELMPTEERDDIGSVKPAGRHTVKYNVIADRYLYNRCHLIGYQLAGENANKKNLITGTRYLNVSGMLPFENEVADYVEATGNHVLYRVTPLYDGDNLVANGVLMEALSVEDGGLGISFCIYAYNVRPGIEIDYADGESRLAKGEAA